MAANKLKATAPIKVTIKASIVSYKPISKYPGSIISPSLTVTFSIGEIMVISPTVFVSNETVAISEIQVSFCISLCKVQSTPNSKNSYNTPIITENAMDTIIRNTGERRKNNRSCLLSSTTSDRLSAEQIMPFTVCNIVSQ